MQYPIATGVTTVYGKLRDQVIAVWTGAGLCNQPVTTIAWPNTDFTPPPNGYWIEPFWRFGVAYPRQLGGTGKGTNLRLGLLFLTICGPKQVGIKVIMGLAEKVAAHFNRQWYDCIYTRIEEGPVNIAEDTQMRYSVTVSFEYNEQI